MVSHASRAQTKDLELSAKSKDKSVVSYAIRILSDDSLITEWYFLYTERYYSVLLG